MTTPDSAAGLREVVRARYAEAARSADRPGDTRDGATVFGAGLYDDETRSADPGTRAALDASLGCGVPTAVAALRAGETVLDLGSGAGGDALVSARQVGPTGQVYGLDMTPEMLEAARRNAASAGLDNVEFLLGHLEDVPLPDAAVDVVISNCVINLAADKRVVLAEAARVTRPGGRLAISDVVADEDMDEATRADMAAWTGCIAGALTDSELSDLLASTGWERVEVETTHRVHDAARAAVVRAVRSTPEPA